MSGSRINFRNDLKIDFEIQGKQELIKRSIERAFFMNQQGQLKAKEGVVYFTDYKVDVSSTDTRGLRTVIVTLISPTLDAENKAMSIMNGIESILSIGNNKETKQMAEKCIRSILKETIIDKVYKIMTDNSVCESHRLDVSREITGEQFSKLRNKNLHNFYITLMEMSDRSNLKSVTDFLNEFENNGMSQFEFNEKLKMLTDLKVVKTYKDNSIMSQERVG